MGQPGNLPALGQGLGVLNILRCLLDEISNGFRLPYPISKRNRHDDFRPAESP